MNGREWEETIEKLVISYVKEYREENCLYKSQGICKKMCEELLFGSAYGRRL